MNKFFLCCLFGLIYCCSDVQQDRKECQPELSYDSLEVNCMYLFPCGLKSGRISILTNDKYEVQRVTETNKQLALKGSKYEYIKGSNIITGDSNGIVYVFEDSFSYYYVIILCQNLVYNCKFKVTLSVQDPIPTSSLPPIPSPTPFPSPSPSPSPSQQLGKWNGKYEVTSQCSSGCCCMKDIFEIEESAISSTTYLTLRGVTTCGSSYTMTTNIDKSYNVVKFTVKDQSLEATLSGDSIYLRNLDLNQCSGIATRTTKGISVSNFKNYSPKAIPLKIISIFFSFFIIIIFY
eukprot:NODE_5386_length_1021_cov_20.447661_g4817_i0.p1 GENE.NODE_5386_length_1021_cov_20.447661_g4817_i0~~NODE_5386_length_1021_cov_20.447661_g4817_i0.p1  ORF type:complete len:291 (-),score=17.11 NODE_5386_length_1021_cov_20.447661_g4817_i0:98-970(-)